MSKARLVILLIILTVAAIVAVLFWEDNRNELPARSSLPARTDAVESVESATTKSPSPNRETAQAVRLQPPNDEETRTASGIPRIRRPLTQKERRRAQLEIHVRSRLGKLWNRYEIDLSKDVLDNIESISDRYRLSLEELTAEKEEIIGRLVQVRVTQGEAYRRGSYRIIPIQGTRVLVRYEDSPEILSLRADMKALDERQRREVRVFFQSITDSGSSEARQLSHKDSVDNRISTYEIIYRRKVPASHYEALRRLIARSHESRAQLEVRLSKALQDVAREKHARGDVHDKPYRLTEDKNLVQYNSQDPQLKDVKRRLREVYHQKWKDIETYLLGIAVPRNR